MARGRAAAGGTPSRRLFVFSGGFLTQTRVRRILTLAGHDLRLGWPGPRDQVGVWGMSPTAARGGRVAARTGAGLVRIEDAFLRSVLPGRSGAPPTGLLIDRQGVHFDGRRRSDLEDLLATHPFDDPALIARARAGIDRLRRADLSKYNAFHPDSPLPEPGHVLVIDQTRGDASLRVCGADRARFRQMLQEARAAHPDARIVIKTHPETAAGHRPGHYQDSDLGEGMRFCAAPLSPWRLLAGARAVYTVSSQMGFEAILAGHRPVVHGQPFYAGWGLSTDRMPVDRRGRALTREELFAGAMLLYPVWYDPCRDRLCDFETAADMIAAQARAWRDDHRGWVATGMRLWKRKALTRVFGQTRGITFADPPDRALVRARALNRPVMVWAGKETPALHDADAVRVEDGFLRSRGLGADLIAPLSLVLDDLGIYYDPSRESRLERLIAASADLTGAERARAAALIDRLLAGGVTKYNLGGAPLPEGLPARLPDRPRILVPGQVEDDASIRLGGGEVRTNRALLAAVRAAAPDAVILFKPHPDVEAGLRPGAVPDAAEFADAVLHRTDPVAALAGADAVWTMTSALGFEALLRGLPVTCLGAPFYAGWGLTTDLGPVPDRRRARPDLIALAHAALIAYPRYHDPVSDLPCPVELAVERLRTGALPRPGTANRMLAKAQGLMAGHSWIWRR